MSLTVSGQKEYNNVVNMMKNNDTEIKFSIDTRALIRTRNCITVMGFPGLIQRQVLASWNINIV